MALALTLAAPIPARSAERASIADVRCSREGPAIRLSFRLAGAFTPELDKAIAAGLPATFSYRVRIFQDVSGWMDERVGELEIKRTLHYDSLRQLYTVLRGESGSTETFKDAQAARRAMSEFENVPVAVSASLSAGASYYLRVKAEMERTEFPSLPFEWPSLFFFAPLWEFKTAWTQVEVPPAEVESAPAPIPAAGGATP